MKYIKDKFEIVLQKRIYLPGELSKTYIGFKPEHDSQPNYFVLSYNVTSGKMFFKFKGSSEVKSWRSNLALRAYSEYSNVIPEDEVHKAFMNIASIFKNLYDGNQEESRAAIRDILTEFALTVCSLNNENKLVLGDTYYSLTEVNCEDESTGLVPW